MTFASRVCSAVLPLLAAFPAAALVPVNNPPVLDPPIPGPTEPARVSPNFPVGKVLFIPLTATDADGDALSYKVTSSNARVLARVKTGNPTLKFTINHAAGGANDPAYSGDLEFMLFRDWTPITAGFIGGFAQSGYYDGTKLHRLSDLNDDGDANTPPLTTTAYIFQGGDPLGSGQGGPGMTGNDPETSWKFQNEFKPWQTFVGRGQLAMANAGTVISARLVNGQVVQPDYSDTNGSQFFITDSQQRDLSTTHFNLDFRHTIFAQLLRGWDLLPKLRATGVAGEAPLIPVNLTGASVVANEHDAVLVLSATGIASSTITVTVEDGKGGKHVRTFTANAVKDAVNSPPFFLPIDPQVAPKGTSSVFALRAVDLEQDFLFYAHRLLQGGTSNARLINSSGSTAAIQPNATFTGGLRAGFDLSVWDTKNSVQSSRKNATFATVGAGDRALSGLAVTVEGEPGVDLPVNTVVGKVADLDSAGAPTNVTAKINWGDGTVIDTAVVQRDTAAPGASTYVALGSHRYARAGVYPIVVTFTGDKGAVAVARSQAIISAPGLRAIGETISFFGATLSNRVVATFSDPVPVAPRSYAASIDWGDGILSAGVIAREGNGRFTVRGTHVYRDAERYTIRVRITKPGAPPVFAWSAAELAFAATPHLPPFPMPNLLGFWQQGPNKSIQRAVGSNFDVSFSGGFAILNTGNKAGPASRLRFWLSSDEILETSGINKDTALKVQGISELFVPALGVGGNAAGSFTVTLPRNVSGAEKFLIAELAYTEPLADGQAVDKYVVQGPIDPPVLLSPNGSTTSESGTSVTIGVKLETVPTANVTVNLVSTNVAEGTLNTSTLNFTTANWNVIQNVTVTGVPDGLDDGNKTYGVKVSSTISTDILFNGFTGAEVTLTNTDINP